MKKTALLFIMTAAVAAALLTGCGSESAAVPSPETAQTAPAADNDKADTAESDSQETDAKEETAEDKPSAAPAGEDSEDAPLPGDSIGPVSFMPNEKGYYMVYGSNTLHAYFKRQDVIPGTGKMTVHRLSDDSVVEEINLEDKEKCLVGEQDSTFSLLGWNSGTHLVIRLADTPESGETYYVNLEEGAFTSSDGTIRSKELTDASSWCYGVANYGVVPSLPSGSAVFVGDVLTADILVRKPAVLARVENYDENRVRFNEKEFQQDGKLDIKIYQLGEDPFTVTFYDEDDNPLGSITLSYTASMPPQPEEEIPQKTITDL
ncbi:hypothetical protein V1224_05395 [Lachnospiraceae bacterium JLR.KK008]